MDWLETGSKILNSDGGSGLDAQDRDAIAPSKAEN